MSTTAQADDVPSEEDTLRAQAYGLLARLLSAPPDDDMLQALRKLAGDDSNVGRAYQTLTTLAQNVSVQQMEEEFNDEEFSNSDMGLAYRALTVSAQNVSVQQVAEEFNDLFIGIGVSELTPYGSYYLTGFLHEKPLAELRADMGRLGIARADDVKEPEDHVAALCEMMAGLIAGSFGAPADLETQHDFFRKHIASWVPEFFEDLLEAEGAGFYMQVGRLGMVFMEIEKQGFEMA